MRTNVFNEPIFQPGDDFFAEWVNFFGEDPEREIARFIEYDDDLGWGCEIADNNDRTAQVTEFKSEEDLRAWLTDNKIEIEG